MANRKNDIIFTLKAIGIGIVVLGIALFIMVFIGMRSVVDGMSMYPTLEDREHVLVDKAIYKRSEPQRFDIIIFEAPYSNTGYYIKRIIGLPGETVKVDYEGNIYIDGELLEEHYGAETIQDPGRAVVPVQVGENEYFVMGDNRNHSEDSRFEAVGNVSKDIILGKVTVRTFPLEKYGYIDLYRERTKNSNGE